jgi:hypothetical protein
MREKTWMPATSAGKTVQKIVAQAAREKIAG